MYTIQARFNDTIATDFFEEKRRKFKYVELVRDSITVAAATRVTVSVRTAIKNNLGCNCYINIYQSLFTILSKPKKNAITVASIFKQLVPQIVIVTV